MSAKIIYDNELITEIKGGETITLKCANEKMEHDLVIEAVGGGSGDSVPEWDGSLTITGGE